MQIMIFFSAADESMPSGEAVRFLFLCLSTCVYFLC